MKCPNSTGTGPVGLNTPLRQKAPFGPSVCTASAASLATPVASKMKEMLPTSVARIGERPARGAPVASANRFDQTPLGTPFRLKRPKPRFEPSREQDHRGEQTHCARPDDHALPRCSRAESLSHGKLAIIRAASIIALAPTVIGSTSTPTSRSSGGTRTNH